MMCLGTICVRIFCGVCYHSQVSRTSWSPLNQSVWWQGHGIGMVMCSRVIATAPGPTFPGWPALRCGSVLLWLSSNKIQFSSVAQSCPTLRDPVDHSTPGLPVHHWLLEFTQTYVHWVGDAIQPSHPLLSPSPPAFNLSQHEGLFQWVSSLHQVGRVLEFQLQHHSFQWIFRTDLL